MIKTIHLTENRRGLHEVTSLVQTLVTEHIPQNGLCTLAIQHTSASLLVQENADPSARSDLQTWLERLVPENDPLYTHTMEGPDDMPAHIKSMLTQTTLSIPVENGLLGLGTWQGIFLWEHRHQAHRRKIMVHLFSD